MPGPACWIAAPEPTNSPAPITPAMAIMDRCLGFRDFESCWSAGMEAPSFVGGSGPLVAGTESNHAVRRTTVSFHTRPPGARSVLCNPTNDDGQDRAIPQQKSLQGNQSCPIGNSAMCLKP